MLFSHWHILWLVNVKTLIENEGAPLDTKKLEKANDTTKKNKNDPKKTPEGAASKSETNLKDSSNKNKEKTKTPANKSSS